MTEHPETVGSHPFLCGLCGEEPRWRLDRHGDAVVQWTCETHLITLLRGLLPTNQHRDQATITDLANAWRPQDRRTTA